MEDLNKLKNDGVDKALKSLKELEIKLRKEEEMKKKIKEMKEELTKAKKEEAELI